MTVSVVLLLAFILIFSLSGVFNSPPTLVYRSNSAKQLYDGSSLTNDGYDLLSGQRKPGHTAKVEVTGIQNGVGKSENRIYVTIFDSLGADVTGDYNMFEDNPKIAELFEGLNMTSGMLIAEESDGRMAAFHDINEMKLPDCPSIDHIGVTTDLCDVKLHRNVLDELIAQSSDHAPVFIDVAVRR